MCTWSKQVSSVAEFTPGLSLTANVFFDSPQVFLFFFLPQKSTKQRCSIPGKYFLKRVFTLYGFSRPISSLQSTFGQNAINFMVTKAMRAERAPWYSPLQRRIQLTRRFKERVRPKMICLVSRNVYKPVLEPKGKLLHGQMEYSRRKWLLQHLSSTRVKFRDVWSLFSRVFCAGFIIKLHLETSVTHIANHFFGRYFASGHIFPYLFSPSPLGGLLEGLLPSLPSLLPSKWKVFEPHFVSISHMFLFPNDAFQNRNESQDTIVLWEGTRAPAETHSGTGRTCRVHREPQLNLEPSCSLKIPQETTGIQHKLQLFFCS